MDLPQGFVVGVLILLTGLGQADDWPQWRGPNRDGVWRETGILETLPRTGLKLRWRARVGPGWSSPSVAQGAVYLTDAQLERPQAQERVLCFDEATGKLRWTYAYAVSYPEWAFPAGQEAGPSATPLAAAGKVFSVGGNGQVLCLDARTGNRLWERRLDKDSKIEVLMCRASPLLDENRLILFVGGKPGACVIALDQASGKEIWKALDEPVTNSSPIVITAGGKRQLIVWTGQSISSLDPTTGKPWWRERLVTSNNDAIATPVFQTNRLLIGGLMLQLAKDRPAAMVRWPATKAVARRILSNTSTALLDGAYVYSARSSGHFVCLEAESGKQVWETDKVTWLRSGASIHPTPQGNGVFLYTDQGELIRAKLSPQGYQELGRALLLEPVYVYGGRRVCWSPPAYANRQVFARNERFLVCARLTTEP